MISYIFNGTSHGEGYVGTISGIPAGLTIDACAVNNELANRKKGVGRSSRQSEGDSVTFSGLTNGVTNGSDIRFEVKNSKVEARENITALRSGHIDVVVAKKFGTDTVRYHNEHASARNSLCYVVVGAIAQQLLAQKGITVSSKVLSIGGKNSESDILQAIEQAKNNGDSLGGIVEVTASGVPSGLGHYFPYELRLDGIISQAMVSIPAVKGIAWGIGSQYAVQSGSEVCDKLTVNNDEIVYETNNCGGIVGGMTNGSDIVLQLTVKPIPTTRLTSTIDSLTHEVVPSHYERADVCVVENVGVIARNMLAIKLFNAINN